MKTKYKLTECGGMRRHGGVFSFGPVSWEMCKNAPVVLLRIEHKDKSRENVPACQECWKELIESKVAKILKAEPIIMGEEYKQN
ncbi:MAG TPA: hypothetical protein P5136_06380 [Methanofastidiosum sp.]|nr:hypothetical protein [Methanofastidiosum sp.]